MSKETCFAFKRRDSVFGRVFSRLSPLQQKILLELSSSSLSLADLSKRTGASVHTIGKQLSLLQLRPKYNPLNGKGVLKPLVRKNKEPGIRTTYSIETTQR